MIKNGKKYNSFYRNGKFYTKGYKNNKQIFGGLPTKIKYIRDFHFDNTSNTYQKVGFQIWSKGVDIGLNSHAKSYGNMTGEYGTNPNPNILLFGNTDPNNINALCFIRPTVEYPRPNVIIDLLGLHEIDYIKIYNWGTALSYECELQVSVDGISWYTFFKKQVEGNGTILTIPYNNNN